MRKSDAGRPLRAAVVGVGLQGMHHVRAYDNLPGTEVVALCDQNLDRARAVADDLHVPAVYGDFAEMFERERLDVVSICTPDPYHLGPALAACRAHLNVLLEKPMATTVEDARQIRDAVEESGITLMVNYANRWQLPTLSAWSALERGELGNPRYAYCRMLNTLSVPTGMIAPWVKQTSLSHWIMSHAIDRVRWFLGGNGKRVHAVATYGVVQALGIDKPDTVHATVEFDNGTIGAFDAWWIMPDVMPFVGGSLFTLVCDRGYVEVDNNLPVVRMATEKRYSYPGVWNGEIFGEPAGSIFEAVKHFVGCLRQGKAPIMNHVDGLEVTKIACAIEESLYMGKEVEIEVG